MDEPVPIEGLCAPGFERVRDEFERNFAERGDLGAAVAVTIAGRSVVDLWGGWANKDRTRAWERDTIVPVWSLGKALTAICVLRGVDAGLIELDAPAARYWPEFAQGGKERLPVRYMLSHQAGLPAIGKPLPPAVNVHDWFATTAALAEQEPWWEPGERFGYHVNTHGFLGGEVLRRADGRDIGTYLREEISKPLGLDFFFGVGPELDSRVADWYPYVAQPSDENMRPWLDRDPATLQGIDLARFMAYKNPPPDPSAGVASRAWRSALFPSTNAHANARAAARVLGALANGGSVDGYRVLSSSLIDEAATIHADGEDAVLGRPNRFGLGFQLTIPGVRPLGPGPRSFGHYGNGAVLGFADPDNHVGFGYVCNQAGRSWRDPRNIALVDAVYACL